MSKVYLVMPDRVIYEGLADAASYCHDEYSIFMGCDVHEPLVVRMIDRNGNTTKSGMEAVQWTFKATHYEQVIYEKELQ